MESVPEEKQKNGLQPHLPKVQYSNSQPVWHYVLLSIVTFSIYDIYWFYRNWKHLKAHKRSEIRPGWRTAGLIVPILNLVLIYWQFSDIKDYATQVGCKKKYSPGWLIWGYFVLKALWKLPAFWWLLTFFSVLPLATVQETLNEYWGIEQSGLKGRKMLTGWEIVLLFIGAIAWLFVFINILRPE